MQPAARPRPRGQVCGQELAREDAGAPLGRHWLRFIFKDDYSAPHFPQEVDMLKKTAQFGDLDVFDAHTHFFSHKFIETLASQSPQLAKESNAVERAAEITCWTMPPRDPAELAAIWSSEFDHYGVSGALMIASVPGDEESVSGAVAAFP